MTLAEIGALVVAEAIGTGLASEVRVDPGRPDAPIVVRLERVVDGGTSCRLGALRHLCVVHGHDMARVPDATDCEDCGVRVLRRRADIFEGGLRALRSVLLEEHFAVGGAGSPRHHRRDQCKTCLALRGVEDDLYKHGNQVRRPDRPAWEPR